MKLDGRVIALTGASGNLGHATANALLERGASLLLLDRHPDRMREAWGPAIDAGRAQAFAVDLSDEASAVKALGDGIAKAGRFDGLVCTVGGYKFATTGETAWTDFAAMLDVNLKTTVACTRAALPALAARGGGAIVHVASLAALAGSTGHAAYSAAKAAVLRFTESVADDVKGQGIRVNAILPGTIDTPQNRAWMTKEQVDVAIDPAAIADVIAFLLSDDARAVTGASIKITGRQ
ncbi:MAG: SDR family oxidoreductase [Polyangiaceae bacterium]|nr:SDR family oxidoreductase [Polyangiaceae bacterium]